MALTFHFRPWITVLLVCAAATTSMFAATTARIASGLVEPVWLTVAPGDSSRLYVLERPGRIRVIQNGQVTASFLDLRTQIESDFQEQGLLGLAFHPDFATNRFFYVNYTRQPDGATVVSRWTATSADQADPASERIVLVQPQPFANHNGGITVFGPDGYLYIGLGDGGSGGDPANNAQNLDTLLGKIIRLDVNSGDPYGIPAGNPFVGEAGRDEIWAYGLRNPWRFSFDRETGDLYIADVGQNRWEEVDVAPTASTGGENYGWRRMEGNHCYNPPANCDDGSLIRPVHEYSHDFGCSITGGYVYRGCALPELRGLYFFADYCSNRIWSFRREGGGIADLRARTDELDPAGNLAIGSISSFGEDHWGELYLCDMEGGEIFKIVPDTLIDTNGNGIADNCEGTSPVRRHGGAGALDDFRLYPGAPNPFNPTTQIAFDLPRSVPVRLTIFDTTGRRVATLLDDSTLAAGHHTIPFRATDLPSGIYIARLETPTFSDSTKLVLLK